MSPHAFIPGELAHRQVIGTCKFGHIGCADHLHFIPGWEEQRDRIKELEKVIDELRADLKETREVLETEHFSRTVGLSHHPLTGSCVVCRLLGLQPSEGSP